MHARTSWRLAFCHRFVKSCIVKPVISFHYCLPGKSMTLWSNGTWTIHGMTPQTMYCTVHLGSSFHMPMMNIIAADTTFVCISLPSKLGLSKEFVGYMIYKDGTPWIKMY